MYQAHQESYAFAYWIYFAVVCIGSIHYRLMFNQSGWIPFTIGMAAAAFYYVAFL